MAAPELGNTIPGAIRYVDTREAPERYRPLLAAGFQSKALAHGDVMFSEAGGGIVCIENKRLYQLIADMTTGQLVRQCRGIIDEADFPWLLIQGPFDAVDGRWQEFPGYTVRQVRDQLATLQDMGMRWERCVYTASVVERTLELEAYYSKGVHLSAMRRVSGDPHIEILMRIPGVGINTASALIAHFGGLRGIATATVETLRERDGIGPKLAQRIYDWMGA